MVDVGVGQSVGVYEVKVQIINVIIKCIVVFSCLYSFCVKHCFALMGI